MEEIVFGSHFNQAVEGTKWPQGMRRLVFGERFNKPVAGAAWPPGLTEICFGRTFDQPLGGPSWPPAGLEILVIGSHFKGDVTGGVGGAGMSEGNEIKTPRYKVHRRASPRSARRAAHQARAKKAAVAAEARAKVNE